MKTGTVYAKYLVSGNKTRVDSNNHYLMQKEAKGPGTTVRIIGG